MSSLFNQVSVFAKAVRDKAAWVARIQRDARTFSNQLQFAMGLTEKDLEDADDLGIEWHTANFTIAARHFAYHRGCGDWVTLLYARDREFNAPGWSNIEFQCNEAEWEYWHKGTGTVLVPSLYLQSRILKEIADVMQSSEVAA